MKQFSMKKFSMKIQNSKIKMKNYNYSINELTSYEN